MAVVDIQGVSKSFPSRDHKGDPVLVLRSISLTIAEGEFFVLLGPSGCGKSTLLRSLAGLESIDSGSIVFDGKTVSGLPAAERNVAMVFQSYALYPHLSVRENIGFSLKMKGAAAAQIEEQVAQVMARLELAELADRYPRELSGGQRQRVAMGRAWVRHPQVLLMDEPLSNLDAKLREQLRYELRTYHEQTPVTTVYVTHDQNEAMSLGDRLGIMHEGLLVQAGTVEELLKRPKNLYVAQFLAQPPLNILKFSGKDEKGFCCGASFVKPLAWESLPQEGQLGLSPRSLSFTSSQSMEEDFVLSGGISFRERYGEGWLYHVTVADCVVKVFSKETYQLKDKVQLNVTLEQSFVFEDKGPFSETLVTPE